VIKRFEKFSVSEKEFQTISQSEDIRSGKDKKPVFLQGLVNILEPAIIIEQMLYHLESIYGTVFLLEGRVHLEPVDLEALGEL
jgi:hypothetical protein